MSPAVQQRVLRVFLCDDTPELRRLVRRAIDAEDDLDVVGEADDPVDGLPLIESLQPEVVLLDLSMPRMDGLEALGHLARIVPDTAIVVFSGLRGDALASKAHALGADAFVEKSAPLPDLIEAVREAAERRRTGERPPAIAPPEPEAVQPSRVIPAARADNLDEVRLPGDNLPTAGLFVLAVLSLALATVLTAALSIPPAILLVLFLAPVVLVADRAGRVGAAAVSVITGVLYAAGASVNEQHLPVGAGIGVFLTAAGLAYATRWARQWVHERATRQADLTRELRRANAELDQFATIASHDLSAPLRTIAGFADILSTRHKGRLSAESDQCLDFITAGTARMSRTIEDLLAFARAGRFEADPRPVALADALEDACLNLTTVIEERAAEIVHGPLPHVIGDRGRLTQLLQNLLANA
ncbi:MAG: hypothetical protein QOF76_2476, partial [Solirubrobacteraceae bacterium]|nr:hypothetical protein [Solirubrobacteraceae bacterium]